MTEVQRIVKMGGVIPEKFLQPETICDFYVDEKRKKIWAVEIDLLLRLDAICRKHNLRYSLAGGSLLGVIRHNGFIPWDDDIDVFMPREDYERLREYKNELEEPYFLQYPGEDNGYAFSFAKLRNSNTTGISLAFRYESFNQGIFLDIFPLDNYQSENLKNNMDIISSLIAECSVLMRRSCPCPDANDLLKISSFPIVRELKDVVKELDDVLRQNELKPSNKYVVWSFLGYNIERLTFDKRLFDDLIEVSFYGYPVFIPRNYDEVLTISFGDYMKFPPIEDRGNRHYNSFFDPDMPYYVSLLRMREEDSNRL